MSQQVLCFSSSLCNLATKSIFHEVKPQCLQSEHSQFIIPCVLLSGFESLSVAEVFGNRERLVANTGSQSSSNAAAAEMEVS